MDLTQLMTMLMRTSVLNIPNQLEPYDVEKCTNKTLLLESHMSCLQRIENIKENMNNDFGIFNITTTMELKSSAAVPLHKENRVDLKDLLESIDRPITGKFLLCRSLCPPLKMTALFAICDDTEGKLCARIALYNFVRDISHSRPKDVYQYLPVGTILAIMNPWFKKTADGGLTVRCDNPADVVVLNGSMVNDIFGSLTWKGRIPSEYHRLAILPSPVNDKSWKRVGNDHFVSKRFDDAIIAYTNGIEDAKNMNNDKLDLLANRSATYLRISKFNLALTDAESVLTVDKMHTKCIYRKCSALFGMKHYEDAVDFLNEIFIAGLSKPDQKIISDLIVKAKSLTAQSLRGEYPWKEIFKNNDQCSNHDLAEFKGTVVVKEIPIKGRGLFASEAIAAGQLILASKAFSYVTDKSDEMYLNMNLSTKYISDRSQTLLITDIAQKLKKDPEKCKEVYELYAGPKFADNIARNSDEYRVDMNRIQAICHYNAFGSKTDNKNAGLWLTPSFINHSCVDGNSFVTVHGDFLFVHASKDIAKDREILISYIHPSGPMPQKELKKYEFICDCRLCIRDRFDDPGIQLERSVLLSRLNLILRKYTAAENMHWHFENDDIEMTNIIQLLENLRKDSPELNLCFMDELQSLAAVYFKIGLFLKSAATLEKLYNVFANISTMYDYSVSVCNNIVSSFLMAGKIHEGKAWIRVLKGKVTLAYGTCNVIEDIFPLTYVLMEDLGLSITDI